MMGRNIIILLIILVLTLLFSYHSILIAKRNHLSGILPPERLKQDQVQAETDESNGESEVQFPNLHMVINIPALKVILFDDGREIARHDIAIGQPMYKTPAGHQEITMIIWNPWWLPPDSPWARGASKEPPGPKNPLGPVKMMMDQGIRLHGTNRDSSVGSAASHGCLRMHNEDAANLAWYIQKRMNNSPDPLFDKYKNNRRTSFYVTLDQPVTVDIIYEPVEVRNDVVYIHNDIYGKARNVTTELIDALMKSGIDIQKIDAHRIKQLKYPKVRQEDIEINLKELLTSTPISKTRFATTE